MADTKISADPSATDLVDAVIPVVQGGANKKAASTLFGVTRVQSVASAATLTPNVDLYDLAVITAQAAALTIAAPTGTPSNGYAFVFRIKDNGTARAITFNAIYRAIGSALPTTTTISKTLYFVAVYNSTDSKWDVFPSNLEV